MDLLLVGHAIPSFDDSVETKYIRTKVWQANLYILKLGEMKVKKIFGKPSVIMAIDEMAETSEVVYFSEAAVTFSCTMDFKIFSYDEQLCSFKLTKYDFLTVEQFIMTNLAAEFGETFDAFSPTDNDYDYQVNIE